MAEDSGKVNHLDGVLLETTARKIAEDSLSELSGRLIQVQDEERRRIARELQDKTSPLLTGLIGKLYTLRHRNRDLDSTTSKSLDESLKFAEETAGVVRNISYLLHPHLLDENGLLASLRWYLSGFTSRSGLAVEMDFPEELARLSRDAEIALFRIVQESLTNILRQPGSKSARVRISVNLPNLMLVVSDQTRGISSSVRDSSKEEASVTNVGIVGMRHRLEQLGGRSWDTW